MIVLVWNIQFFTESRISDSSGNTQQEQQYNQALSSANLLHILKTVILGNTDVFVVVEPRSSQGNIGTLATGGGPDGLYLIWQCLRKANIGWALVPPQRTLSKDWDGVTYTESVGFFYRSDKYDFVGPWVWPGGNGPAVAAGNQANYPGRWATTMPGGNQFASQTQFFDANNNNAEVLFLNQQNRRPVLSCFRQKVLVNPITYKILACHTTPNAEAGGATSKILGLAEAQAGAYQVSAVVGDFNVDLLDALKGGTLLGVVNMANFTPAFTGQYGPTMTKKVNDATANAYFKNASYDNLFVQYGANTVAPNPNKTIIDMAAGTGQFVTSMQNNLVTCQQALNSDAMFRNYVNYGHIGNIYGTSDHLAIVSEI